MDTTPLIDAAISAISSVAVEQVIEGLKDKYTEIFQEQR